MADEDDRGVTFDAIYRENAWNGVESVSGPGSGPVATRMLADELRFIVDLHGIESVLDVGCGDGYWMPDLPGYVGYDASRIALDYSRSRHPERTYVSVWPRHRRFDLVICRDVIQHLSLADGLALLDRVRDLGPRFLFASTYRGGINVDIESGVGSYAPDLEVEPFNLPAPRYWVFDGYAYHFTETPRDPRKFMALWVVNAGIVRPAE